jgi:hypothetical protein
MYVDGSQVVTATHTIATSDSSQVYAGYWHLGWSNITSSLEGWADKPSDGYWLGSLGQVTVFPTVLTASNISSLYDETSDAAYATAVTGGVAASTYYWPLDGAPQYGDFSANPGTNYGTGYGVVGSDASGPIATLATTFDGSTTYIPTNTQIASPGPQTFSIAAWFKTSSPTGSIIGFDSSQTKAAPGSSDRMLWMDPSGHLVFYMGSPAFGVTSSGTYANGAWHFVVLIVNPVTATSGTVEMYVDGSLVAGSTLNDTSFTGGHPAQAYGGYWHLGWSYAIGGWPDLPTTLFWKGSLGQIAVFPTALSAAQVATLYGDSSAAAYQLAVTGGVASSNAYWPLNDWPATLSVSPACTYVGLTVQATGTVTATCLYPAISVTCPTTPPITAWPTTASGTIPVPFTNLTYETAVNLGAVTVPTGGVGLHVAVGPVTISESGGGFTATVVHPLGNVGYLTL